MLSGGHGGDKRSGEETRSAELLFEQPIKKRAGKSPALLVSVSDASPPSSESDVLGARAFWTLANGESHRLAFAQLLEADAFEAGHVEEQILALAGVDESKTLVGESLDGTLCHSWSFLQ